MASGIIPISNGGLVWTSEQATNNWGKCNIEWARQGAVVYIKLVATATTQIGTSMGDFHFSTMPTPNHGFVIPLTPSLGTDVNTKFAQNGGSQMEKSFIVRGAFSNGEAGKGLGVYITSE